MKSFIFIIPLTPPSHINAIRQQLQQLCFHTLVAQTYPNWRALLIGQKPAYLPNDERFITIDFEGKKEEKLQTASEYIISNNLPGDYLIRLDDDDIINPEILNRVQDLEFDVYTDLYQTFVSYDLNKIAQRLWYWFPNTCIHKRDCALAPWSEYEPREFRRFRDKPYLIENDHSKIHHFYKKKKVVYASKRHPVYLRVISDISVTAMTTSKDKLSFMNRYGMWIINELPDFQFVNFEPRYHLHQNIWHWLKFEAENAKHYFKLKKQNCY